jgi:hypothetical protein
MTATRALRTAAVVGGALGVHLLAAPANYLAIFEAGDAGDTTFWLRRYGVLFLAVAVIFWLAGGWDSPRARRDVLVGGIVITVLMTVLSIYGLVEEVVGPLYWGFVAVEVVLAAWFIWLVARGET